MKSRQKEGVKILEGDQEKLEEMKNLALETQEIMYVAQSSLRDDRELVKRVFSHGDGMSEDLIESEKLVAVIDRRAFCTKFITWLIAVFLGVLIVMTIVFKWMF